MSLAVPEPRSSRTQTNTYRRVAGLDHAGDRLFSLPDKRKGYVGIEANEIGPELSAGLRLWSADWSDGGLYGWAGSEWESLRKWQAGIRAEMRF